MSEEREGGGKEELCTSRRSGEKGKKGKEKTRLPQHDLQIALSPWRLLSAPLFDPKWWSKQQCHSLSRMRVGSTVVRKKEEVEDEVLTKIPFSNCL